MQNKHHHKRKVSFKQEWPFIIILRLVRKYTDKRGRLQIIKGKGPVIKYAVFNKKTRKWDNREMDRKGVHLLFTDLYGEGGYYVQ